MARDPKSNARASASKGAKARASASKPARAPRSAGRPKIGSVPMLENVLEHKAVQWLVALGRHIGHKAAKALGALAHLTRNLRAMGRAAKVAVPLFVLALGAVSYAGLKAMAPEIVNQSAQEKIWPVYTTQVDFSNFQPEIRLYGVTIPGRQVELRALVAGKVIEAGKALRTGGEVKEGEVLLRIDPFEYQGALDEAKAQRDEAKARLKEIKATVKSEKDMLSHAREQLNISERDLARAVPLVERGAVSKKLADDRRMVVSERDQAVQMHLNNLAIQRAKAEQQKATIAQLDWKVRKTERDLQDTELKAPFDAYVKSASADLGRLLGVNDAVATLLDQAWIEARFTLTDSQYGRIATRDTKVTGRTIKVVWRVGEKLVEYEAVIERVAAEIASEQGGVEVYARLKDPLNPIPIRPGAFIEIEARDRTYSNVARLPQTALYAGNTVFVIVGGRLTARQVEIVGIAGQDVLVKGSIVQGEMVVTTRLTNAGEGLAVKDHKIP